MPCNGDCNQGRECICECKEVVANGKLADFVVPEHIVVEFTDAGAKLDFQHLFDKGIRGNYKIILEKIE
jgi:hypothetical protein